MEKTPREERGSLLRFAMGFSPILRAASCEKCNYAYDFSAPQTMPATHLLVNCPSFAAQRQPLLAKVSKILTTHSPLMLTHFNQSLVGDGTLAAAVLLGCNSITFDSVVSEAAHVFRRLGKPIKGRPKVATQINTIPSHTAKFVWQICQAHKLSDPEET